MKTMYVLLQHDGQYDSVSTELILSSFDKQKLEDKTEEMMIRRETRNLALAHIEGQMSLWEKTNPRVNVENFRVTPLPMFKGKKGSWTAEQKATYERVKETNQKGQMAAGEGFKNWVNNRYQELCRITALLPQQVQEDLQNLREDSEWVIEEVPYVD